MYQIAVAMQQPGDRSSRAIMYGGSMLALAGIAHRVSEDADFVICYRSLDEWSDSRGRKTLKRFESRVVEQSGVLASASDGRESGLSRCVSYAYPSALVTVEDSEEAHVASDMSFRLIDQAFVIELPNALPLLGRVTAGSGTAAPADFATSPVRALHPICSLIDKCDAIAWRCDLPEQQMQAALARRVRDYYDLWCLIEWAERAGHLTRGDLEDAERHMSASEERYREMRFKGVRRADRLRQSAQRDSYHHLPCWTPGTAAYEAVAAEYPTLATAVYGDMPVWPDLAARARSALDL